MPRCYQICIAQCLYSDRDDLLETLLKITNQHSKKSGGGARFQKRLVLVSYTYDPPIYDITSDCKVAALFWREPTLQKVHFRFTCVAHYTSLLKLPNIAQSALETDFRKKTD